MAFVPTNQPCIDTGYRVVAGSIDKGNEPSGYRIDGERILQGTGDTGYFVAGETIYQKPRLDTGFRVCGGIVFGPGSELPFRGKPTERPVAKTTKIEPLQVQAVAG